MINPLSGFAFGLLVHRNWDVPGGSYLRYGLQHSRELSKQMRSIVPKVSAGLRMEFK